MVVSCRPVLESANHASRALHALDNPDLTKAVQAGRRRPRAMPSHQAASPMITQTIEQRPPGHLLVTITSLRYAYSEN